MYTSSCHRANRQISVQHGWCLQSMLRNDRPRLASVGGSIVVLKGSGRTCEEIRNQRFLELRMRRPMEKTGKSVKSLGKLWKSEITLKLGRNLEIVKSLGNLEITWKSAIRQHYWYKWKNHFYEMKGDVGM